ncbi:MAG: hypothetical protein FWH23_06785 [Bacteroidales bacterium]|nr:hypothetical protein [Bacteroidales bacterium]MCL2132943.1 hypothetical protein [Bacteroidales bacterium]
MEKYKATIKYNSSKISFCKGFDKDTVFLQNYKKNGAAEAAPFTKI